MTQLVVLYRLPKDPAHFEKYYREVHGPMTGKLYGIGGYKYGRVHALDGLAPANSSGTGPAHSTADRLPSMRWRRRKA